MFGGVVFRPPQKKHQEKYRSQSRENLHGSNFLLVSPRLYVSEIVIMQSGIKFSCFTEEKEPYQCEGRSLGGVLIPKNSLPFFPSNITSFPPPLNIISIPSLNWSLFIKISWSFSFFPSFKKSFYFFHLISLY